MNFPICPPDLSTSLTAAVLWLVCWLIPIALLSIGCYSALAGRLRQRERIGFFLDLLETALQGSGPVEKALIAIGRADESGAGRDLNRLATHLEQGLRLDQALEKTSTLPPQIIAIIRAGIHAGDLRKILPACRQLERDIASQARNSVQHLAWLGFISIPLVLMMATLLKVMVFPKFRSIFADMAGGGSPWLNLVSDYSYLLITLMAVVCVALWLTLFFFEHRSHQSPPLIRLADRAAFHVRWMHKRMQRDFSAMLAVLLDCGTPEADAVELAADCTANETFRRNARSAATRVRQGTSLITAVETLDQSGELQWRLKNAAHSRDGFLSSLTGWGESLAAAASHGEQAAALTVASIGIVLNGAFVALLALATFEPLIRVLDAQFLW